MKTAIAEMRPARGFLVSVAELCVSNDLQVLDLVGEHVRLNPFLEESIPYWLELDELLSRIAWALAKPLEREDNPLDYVPSQRLSEFAEDVHFDGIRYPSAMDRGGTNIVLFDQRNCEIGPSKLLKVTALDVEFTEDIEQLTDDFPDL
jgi:hypothetical protein